VNDAEVSQELTVVAQEDHKRVFKPSGLFKVVKQTSDLIVNVSALTHIHSYGSAQFGFGALMGS
jgi:hypothetical protein